MSFYKELFDIVKKELYVREGTLPAQRQDIELKEEAATITRIVIGNILEAIEQEWKP